MGEGIPNRIERKEKAKETLIVEVGSGSLPMFADTTAEYRARFDADPGARYLGIDLDPDELRLGKELQERRDTERGVEPNERITYVNAKADALPLRDGSADELVVRNVLGDPDIPVEEKHALLHEAARVIRQGGTLKVIEVYTPLMVYEDDLYAYIDAMEGRPFTELTKEETEALPQFEQDNDRELFKDVLAADSFKMGNSFTLRYRRS